MRRNICRLAIIIIRALRSGSGSSGASSVSALYRLAVSMHFVSLLSHQPFQLLLSIHQQVMPSLEYIRQPAIM